MRCVRGFAADESSFTVVLDMLRFALAAYPEDKVFIEPMVSLRCRFGMSPRPLLMLPLLLFMSPLPLEVGTGLEATACAVDCRSALIALRASLSSSPGQSAGTLSSHLLWHV